MNEPNLTELPEQDESTSASTSDIPSRHIVKKYGNEERADQSETRRRILLVVQLILSGMNSYAIVQTITAPEHKSGWGIKERQARNYIAKARELIATEFEETKDLIYREHILHRRDLRKRANAAGDFQAELRTAQDEAKLMGLYPGDKSLQRFDEMETADIITLVTSLLGGNDSQQTKPTE